jgi:hypothetical protein
MNILIEALFVGILLAVVGGVIHLLALQFHGKHDLNSIPMYLVHLFVAGVIVHLLCEVIGLNKYYCAHGNACK